MNTSRTWTSRLTSSCRAHSRMLSEMPSIQPTQGPLWLSRFISRLATRTCSLQIVEPLLLFLLLHFLFFLEQLHVLGRHFNFRLLCMGIRIGLLGRGFVIKVVGHLAEGAACCGRFARWGVLGCGEGIVAGDLI